MRPIGPGGSAGNNNQEGVLKREDVENTGSKERERRANGDRSGVRSIVPGVVRRSYALKFTLALLVVVLLIAGIGAASYVQIQGIIEEDAERTLQSSATLRSDAVSEWLAGMESQTRGIAAADVYGTQDPEQIREHLRDSQTLVGEDVVGIHYVDPDGDEIVASTEGEYEGESIAATAPAWRAPIERATGESADGSVASSEHAYERNGELLVAFVRPVRVGDGAVVVVADVRRGFERLHGSDTQTTSVLNADGNAVTAPRRTTPMPIAETAAFETALNGDTAVHERETDIVAFAPVDGADWIVVTEAPKAQLYEASETVGRNVVFLLLSSLVALTAVGIVLGRGTVLPLIRLRERTQALEAGDFDVDLRSDREDEIGRLFAAFAKMRDALREQIRQTEAARERAEQSRRELERQNERLDQFASTVSHDLRNPLNVADGYRELLELELADADGGGDIAVDDMREHVRRIDESHERMETIIDDVLTLARGSERIDAAAEVDLESIATDAWTTVDHGDATLEVIDTLTFDADRERLRRVFENLFRNAIEHGGADVTVEVGPVESGEGFYLADDGPGIPPEIVDDAFEYGATTADDGTGFGLAIVEAIVTAHGWTIDVDESADGARFVIAGIDDD